jgi:DNA replication protein DnaC
LEAILAGGKLPDLDTLEAPFAPASVTSPHVTVTLPPAITCNAMLEHRCGGGLDMSKISITTARPPLLLHPVRLPAITRLWQDIAARSEKEAWPAIPFHSAFAELEVAERARHRTERHLAESRLPTGKTLDSFDFTAVPMLSKAHALALAFGDAWLGKLANLLLFGPPGRSKSHVAAALGRGLIEHGYRVPFLRTTDIVRHLQAECQALQLAAVIAKPDRFDLLILDNLSYASTDPAETSMLFELVAARSERRSLMITVHQPFGETSKVFPTRR